MVISYKNSSQPSAVSYHLPPKAAKNLSPSHRVFTVRVLEIATDATNTAAPHQSGGTKGDGASTVSGTAAGVAVRGCVPAQFGTARFDPREIVHAQGKGRSGNRRGAFANR